MLPFAGDIGPVVTSNCTTTVCMPFVACEGLTGCDSFNPLHFFVNGEGVAKEYPSQEGQTVGFSVVHSSFRPSYETFIISAFLHDFLDEQRDFLSLSVIVEACVLKTCTTAAISLSRGLEHRHRLPKCPISQLANQPVSQLANQPISQLASQPVKRRSEEIFFKREINIFKPEILKYILDIQCVFVILQYLVTLQRDGHCTDFCSFLPDIYIRGHHSLATKSSFPIYEVIVPYL